MTWRCENVREVSVHVLCWKNELTSRLKSLNTIAQYARRYAVRHRARVGLTGPLVGREKVGLSLLPKPYVFSQ